MPGTVGICLISKGLREAMSFSINPYVGVNNVRFGASPSDVTAEWGSPVHVSTTWLGELEETRGGVSCRYNADGLVEVAFGRMASVAFDGVDLLHDPEALQVLLRKDPTPYELHGFLVFFELGIALTGVHDHDEDQLAAGAFIHGRWDPFRSKMRPWSPQSAANDD